MKLSAGAKVLFYYIDVAPTAEGARSPRLKVFVSKVLQILAKNSEKGELGSSMATVIPWRVTGLTAKEKSILCL